jgi:hypothetical protein
VEVQIPALIRSYCSSATGILRDAHLRRNRKGAEVERMISTSPQTRDKFGLGIHGVRMTKLEK